MATNEAKTPKAPNYTEEQSAMVVARYTANPTKETVEALAKELGKTTRSIIAKLSRAEVYKKAEYVNKNGEKPVKKDDMADKLAAIVGLSDAETDSLAKANKTALVKIYVFMEKLVSLADAAAKRAETAEADADILRKANEWVPEDTPSREG